MNRTSVATTLLQELKENYFSFHHQIVKDLQEVQSQLEHLTFDYYEQLEPSIETIIKDKMIKCCRTVYYACETIKTNIVQQMMIGTLIFENFDEISFALTGSSKDWTLSRIKASLALIINIRDALRDNFDKIYLNLETCPKTRQVFDVTWFLIPIFDRLKKSFIDHLRYLYWGLEKLGKEVEKKVEKIATNYPSNSSTNSPSHSSANDLACGTAIGAANDAAIGAANGTANDAAIGAANGTATDVANGAANGTANAVANAAANDAANDVANAVANGIANDVANDAANDILTDSETDSVCGLVEEE